MLSGYIGAKVPAGFGPWRCRRERDCGGWTRRLDAAETLQDLAAFPGNRLEALRGNRKGQHSIRVNDQWRICFRWSEGKAFDVEIVDYH